MRLLTIGLMAIAFASSANAKERKIVDPLSENLVANNHVVGVEVRLSPTALEKMAEFDKKAAEKRAEAKLPPVSPPPGAAPAAETEAKIAAADVSVPTRMPESPAVESATSIRPAKDEYATLPFANMFPLVIEDVTKDWGLVGGKPVKLVVTIDTLKTANAAMAILIAASSDQLAGMVEVRDAATDAALGSFYVDVINSHGGWLGMAMRGSGVREKLTEEFALQTSRVLTGRKSKKARKA